MASDLPASDLAADLRGPAVERQRIKEVKLSHYSGRSILMANFGFRSDASSTEMSMWLSLGGLKTSSGQMRPNLLPSGMTETSKSICLSADW